MMGVRVQHCAIAILAAGQSKRLGTPKQLLMYEGNTLINRLINIVKHAGDFPITLVLGAYADQIISQLSTDKLNVVMNPHWEEGMGSSIRLAVQHIMEHSPDVDSIMILVCDQPFISATHIHGILDMQHHTGKPIVASYYDGTAGTPALFHKDTFVALLSLQGDSGAKKFINTKMFEVAKMPFERGRIDIDTQDDYMELFSQQPCP
jgi:molybdenum cofactor cytidylyltransferase